MPFPNSAIAHPRMMQALNYHFNSTGRLFKRTVIQNDFGEEEETYTGSDQVLKAYVEPVTGSQEVRRPDDTLVTLAFTVALQEYYPEIALSDKLLIEGRYHNVLGIASDDTKTYTLLTTEIINPDQSLINAS